MEKNTKMDKNMEAELDMDMKPLKKQSKKDGLKDCKDFDDILNVIGGQNKFQRIMLYACLCPMTLLFPFFTMNLIFLLYVPDHWCHVPQNVTSFALDNYEYDIESWKNLTIPMEMGLNDKERYSQCLMYDPENDTNTISCKYGWDYDKSDYASTIPSEYNWVCNKMSYATNAFTITAVGNAVGTVIFGIAADKYGRKPVFYTTWFISVFFRLLSLFVAKHLAAFLAAQFMIGTAFPMIFITLSMINVEACNVGYRAWVYAVTWMMWVFGMSLMPLIVWLCSSWRVIGFVTSLPGLCFILYYRFLPESPRWLVGVGRIDEAKRTILRIAKMNGNNDKISPYRLETLLKKIYNKMKAERENKKQIGIWTLFIKKRLAKHTILLTISWSANLLIYYGITLNTPNMSGNQFFNFFLLSIIELPACWTGGLLAEKLGRRWLQVVFYFVLSMTCLVSAISVVSLDNLVLACIIVAKFSVTLTNLVMYMQGTEIFPTELRSTGTGFASTIGCTFGILGPYIIFLGRFNIRGPYIVMAILGLVGMTVSSFLPETNKQNLPQTVEEANSFGKYNKYFSLRPAKIPAKTTDDNKNDSTKLKTKMDDADFS